MSLGEILEGFSYIIQQQDLQPRLFVSIAWSANSCKAVISARVARKRYAEKGFYNYNTLILDLILFLFLKFHDTLTKTLIFLLLCIIYVGHVVVGKGI